ncbi:hypothetical protein OROMI_005122 [Orobanche minor]
MKLNVGTMDDDLYGYYPQSIQNMGNKGEEAFGYTASRMSDAKKQIYLGAYHHDEHWQLLVIISEKGKVVWFCSLHRKPDNRIKAVVQNVMTAYKVMGVCIQVDPNRRFLGYIPNVINKAEVGSVGITSCTGWRLLYELVLPMDGWRCLMILQHFLKIEFVKFKPNGQNNFWSACESWRTRELEKCNVYCDEGVLQFANSEKKQYEAKSAPRVMFKW